MNQSKYDSWNYGNRGEYNCSQSGGHRGRFRSRYPNPNANINKNVSGRQILPTPITFPQHIHNTCQIYGLSSHLALDCYHHYSQRAHLSV